MERSEYPEGRRRRIDRVTAPDYLDGLADRTAAAEIRAMRDDCRSEETRLSYARRVLQGQLDIARVGALPTGGAEADEAAWSPPSRGRSPTTPRPGRARPARRRCTRRRRTPTATAPTTRSWTTPSSAGWRPRRRRA